LLCELPLTISNKIQKKEMPVTKFEPTPAPTQKGILAALQSGAVEEFSLAGNLSCGLPALRTELNRMKSAGLVKSEVRVTSDFPLEEMIYWDLEF
jgi:hypothetical protein